jgi:exodeoxyribonuclease VII large subunit
MLRLLAPNATLARGYSITIKPDGSTLRSVGEAQPGMQLVTRLADGEVQSVITSE